MEFSPVSQQLQSQHHEQFSKVQRQYSGQGSSQSQENVAAGRYTAAPTAQPHKTVSQPPPQFHTMNQNQTNPYPNQQMIPYPTPAAQPYNPYNNNNNNAVPAPVPQYKPQTTYPMQQQQQQPQQQHFYAPPPPPPPQPQQQPVPMNTPPINERPYRSYQQPPLLPPPLPPLPPHHYQNHRQQHDDDADGIPPIVPDMSGLTDSNHHSSNSIHSDLTDSRHGPSAPSPLTSMIMTTTTTTAAANYQNGRADTKPVYSNTTPQPPPDQSCEDLLGLITIKPDVELPPTIPPQSITDTDQPSPPNRTITTTTNEPQTKPPSSPRSPRSHPTLTTTPNPLQNLAPPPPHPSSTKDPYMRQQKLHTNLHYRNGMLSPLPKFASIGHSGHVLARCSPKSLIIKKWKRMFWVTYGESELLVFRGREDFDEWAMNPYMGWNERNNLVKLRVDFKRGARGNLGVKCFRATGLREKEYGKMGTMCNFKLERWMHHGPVVLGAFASNDQTEVGAFQVILNDLIERQGYGMKHLVNHEDPDGIASNLLHTICSSNAKSVRV